MNYTKYEKSLDINKPLAFSSFTNLFEECFYTFYNNTFSDIVFVCIGTDRATGDALGPLVGYKLNEMKFDNVYVHGTLDQPVHAKNLDSYVNSMEKYNRPFIIAIDASLGNSARVGFISLKEGPLCPGAGVNKTLPKIGNINITGIVNVGGFLEMMVLQNTRLNLVMNMADIISNGIRYNMWKINENSKNFKNSFKTDLKEYTGSHR